jgi:hypothetical protein
VTPNKSLPHLLKPLFLYERSRLPRVYSRACGCVFIGGIYNARVCGAARAFQYGGPLLICAIGFPKVLASTSARSQFLKTPLFAHDTSLGVGVLAGTHRTGSSKSLLSYSLHLFRVMGIVATGAADTGMSFTRTLPLP